MVIEADFILFARIHSLAQKPELPQRVGGQAKLFTHSLLQATLMQQANAHIINL